MPPRRGSGARQRAGSGSGPRVGVRRSGLLAGRAPRVKGWAARLDILATEGSTRGQARGMGASGVFWRQKCGDIARAGPIVAQMWQTRPTRLDQGESDPSDGRSKDGGARRPVRTDGGGGAAGGAARRGHAVPRRAHRGASAARVGRAPAPPQGPTFRLAEGRLWLRRKGYRPRTGGTRPKAWAGGRHLRRAAGRWNVRGVSRPCRRPPARRCGP